MRKKDSLWAFHNISSERQHPQQNNFHTDIHLNHTSNLFFNCFTTHAKISKWQVSIFILSKINNYFIFLRDKKAERLCMKLNIHEETSVLNYLLSRPKLILVLIRSVLHISLTASKSDQCSDSEESHPLPYFHAQSSLTVLLCTPLYMSHTSSPLFHCSLWLCLLLFFINHSNILSWLHMFL